MKSSGSSPYFLQATHTIKPARQERFKISMQNSGQKFLINVLFFSEQNAFQGPLSQAQLGKIFRVVCLHGKVLGNAAPSAGRGYDEINGSS